MRDCTDFAEDEDDGDRSNEGRNDNQGDLPHMELHPGLNPEDAVAREIAARNGGRWPKVLTELVDHVEAAFKRAGRSDEEALKLALVAVRAVSNCVGGKQNYIPRGDAIDTALRHAQAWRLFRGDNMEEVMSFLGVTYSRAYAIIAEQRALHVNRLQPPLPLPPP